MTPMRSPTRPRRGARRGARSRRRWRRPRRRRRPVGDRRDEVLRHGDDLGVVREPPPPHATRSPGATPSTPAPTSSTIPADEYPSGASASSRSRAACSASPTPSALARSTTLRTRSGRARAFCRRLLPPTSIFDRSVPALISEQRLATRSHPGRSAGRGASTTVIRPSRGRWATCFTDRPPRWPHGRRSPLRSSSALRGTRRAAGSRGAPPRGRCPASECLMSPGRSASYAARSCGPGLSRRFRSRWFRVIRSPQAMLNASRRRPGVHRVDVRLHHVVDVGEVARLLAVPVDRSGALALERGGDEAPA